jgi:hypothetical protein
MKFRSSNFLLINYILFVSLVFAGDINIFWDSNNTRVSSMRSKRIFTKFMLALT